MLASGSAGTGGGVREHVLTETMGEPGPYDDGGFHDAEPVPPPAGILLLAGVSLLIATVLIPIGIIALHWTGYGLAAIVTIVLVARFRAVDQRRRQNPFYAPRSHLRRSTPWVMAGAYLVAVAHAWLLATHYAS